MRVVVYTAIFGTIGDKLQPLKHRAYRDGKDSLDYYAFVDGMLPNQEQKDKTGWIKRAPVWEHKTNPRLRARRHKLQPHLLFPEADVTLWLDGCLTPSENPVDIANYYLCGGAYLCAFEHMQRDCVYQEGRACIKLGKDHPDIINAVLTHYKLEGYPEHNGLAETTAVLRRNNDVVNKFNDAWWDLLRNGSIRDQLSFDFLVWQQQLEYMTFEGQRTNNPHFSWIGHR